MNQPNYQPLRLPLARLSTVLALIVPLLLCPVATTAAETREPLRLHPENPKYFLFRGKPTALITASEHYGSVLNRPFDFRKYLDDAAARKMTVTRTFMLYREFASDMNPMSPCKPKTEDFIAPWPRTGGGKALDGQPLYDLDTWNDEYFKRLHDFLEAASERGVIVEVTIFSNTYGDPVWNVNPLNARNNKQQIGKVAWQEYNTLKDADLLARQVAFARKIAEETSGYDNIYYEICNEPGGGFPDHASPADVDAWQAEIARVLREACVKTGHPHLLAGYEAFTYAPKFFTPYDQTYGDKIFDIVNVHPLPDTVLGGRHFQMGNFMSRELKLQELIDYGLASWKLGKPSIWDEDNAASKFTDPVGWTIHRKRAWAALLTGSHYDMIDFSIQIGKETGTPESATALRSWIGYLASFFNTLDFVHAAPQPQVVRKSPGVALSIAFGVEGKDYAIYLADPREVADPDQGKPIVGDLALTLPKGRYNVSFFNPQTGASIEAGEIEGGAVSVNVPQFIQDVAVRIRRR